MYTTVTNTMFIEAFDIRPDNFSREGLDALFDYLEELDVELDVIALCCDYSEDDIGIVLDEHQVGSVEELENETTVIWHNDDRVLYQQY